LFYMIFVCFIYKSKIIQSKIIIMSNHSKRLTFAILNLVGYVGVLIVNYLAVSLPLNGKDTGALSDQYPNLFVPAGLTFSIWGIIFILLGIFVVYSLVYTLQNRNLTTSTFLDKIGYWFLISCIANMSWLFAWHYEILPLSLLIMLLILGSLIAIYQRQRIGNSNVSNTEKYLTHLPFSIYLGWISVATIANVTALLVNAGVGGLGLGEPLWAVAVILVAITLAMVMIFNRNDIFYALVVAWALLGIYLKRSAALDVVQVITITAIIGMSLILLTSLVQIFRRRVYRN